MVAGTSATERLNTLIYLILSSVTAHEDGLTLYDLHDYLLNRRPGGVTITVELGELNSQIEELELQGLVKRTSDGTLKITDSGSYYLERASFGVSTTGGYVVLQQSSGGWYNREGPYYQIKSLPEDKAIILLWHQAELRVRKTGRDIFTIEWKINHGNGKVSGQVDFSKEDLRRAFGIKKGCEPRHVMFMRKYEAVAAYPGKYVRQDLRLNIPCPGTGFNGDPNISIDIKPELVAAIKTLLRND